MKNVAILSLILATIILITIVVLSAATVSYPIIYFLTIFGQIIFIFSVYMVLTDNYTTTKTFDDWYEDSPKEKE